MATPQEALSTAHERWNAGDLDGYLKLYDERTAGWPNLEHSAPPLRRP
jgi:hypothetical protein